MHKKNNKVLLKVLFLLTVLTLAYGGISYYFSNHFYPLTSVNGVNIGCLSDSAALKKLRTASEVSEIVIRKKNDTIESLELEGLGSYREYKSLQHVIDQQESLKWPLEAFSVKNIDAEYTGFYNADALAELVRELRIVRENVSPESAYIEKNEQTGRYEIIEEVYGDAVDVDALIARAAECVASGIDEIWLKEEGIYIEPGQKATDEYLIANAELLNRIDGMDIELDLSADLKHKFETEYIYSSYADPAAGDYTIDEARLNEIADGIAMRYDTASEDGTRLFHSAQGRTVSIKTDYGWLLDKEKTIENLRGCFANLAEILSSGNTEVSSVTANAVWSRKAVSHMPRDIGNTYAEVDITNQMVYMIKDKKLVLSSPCVTGLLGGGRATPPGIFTLTYKQPGKVLTGRRPDGSISYQSPVSFWMPFNKGIGFHDATWRGKFGGEIYKRNGSHGCINMPYNKAKELYQYVYKDMPVVCYL